MIERPGNNDVFENMVRSGKVSTGNRWIERAAKEKHPRLTLELACSKLLIYDTAEKLLFSITDLN